MSQRWIPVVLLLAACGGDDAASDGGSDPVPMIDFRPHQEPERDQGIPNPDGGQPVDARLPTDQGPMLDKGVIPDVLSLDMQVADVLPPDMLIDAQIADMLQPPPDGNCGGPEEIVLIEAINAHRRTAGLAVLACDSLIGNATRAHSQAMCDGEFFAVGAPDGTEPLDRIRAAGSNAMRWGVNISRGSADPEAVFERWVMREGTLRWLESDEYGRVGVGFVACDERPHWTLYAVD